MHPTTSNLRIALYARASSEQQGNPSSITRQLVELRQRIAQEGGSLDDQACFVDKGQPVLLWRGPPCNASARLRPAATWIVSTFLLLTALARSPASLAQLTDEFAQAGVELIFVDPTASQSA